MVNIEPESVQHVSIVSRNGSNARVSNRVSKSSLRRFDTHTFTKNDDARTSGGTVREKVEQTERRVWDILNAGPLHRFTVEGLLVSNCLVMDFAGNVLRHGPIDLLAASNSAGASTNSAPGEAPFRVCPQCCEVTPLAALSCVCCGYEFPVIESPPHDVEASDAPMLSRDAKQVTSVCRSMAYSRHRKQGKPDSFRVDYQHGYESWVSEWWCFEHTGYARTKAVESWALHAGTPTPTSVSEALQRVAELKQPSHIDMKRDASKYLRVEKVYFARSSRTEEDAGVAS